MLRKRESDLTAGASLCVSKHLRDWSVEVNKMLESTTNSGLCLAAEPDL